MPNSPPRATLIAAFAAVYFIWGSTYLAIRFAIETLPPFMMAAVRFLAAGMLLYGWARLYSRGSRPVARPARGEWRTALIIGALLLLGGNGGVVWAEQIVSSGMTALLVAVTPCWMVLLDWLWRGAERPGARTAMGLLMGFGGIALLIGPVAVTESSQIPLAGIIALTISSLSWAIGSIYAKRLPPPSDGVLFTGMQMMAGGACLLLLGAVTGEFARFDPAGVSATSLFALAYLFVFGSVIGYSAYIWLLRVTTPARVSTYAYVNPVVAVFLGWAIASEPVTARTLAAAAIIIAGVVLITTGDRSNAKGQPPNDQPGPSDSQTPTADRSASS